MITEGREGRKEGDPQTLLASIDTYTHTHAHTHTYKYSSSVGWVDLVQAEGVGRAVSGQEQRRLLVVTPHILAFLDAPKCFFVSCLSVCVCICG